MRVLGLTLKGGTKHFCDSHCHNSTRPHCSCICGGQLHGKGDSYAMLNARGVSAYFHHANSDVGIIWLNPQLVGHY